MPRVSIVIALSSLVVAGCSSPSPLAWLDPSGTSPQTTPTSTTPATPTFGLCTSCLSDKDCSGGVCAQFQGDSYCAMACPNGDECASTSSCQGISTANGEQLSACVPNGDACGGGTSSGGGNGGGSGTSSSGASSGTSSGGKSGNGS